ASLRRAIQGFFRRRLEWQSDEKTRVARFRIDLDFAAMAIGHNAVADDEAEAGAMTDRLRREEWLEQSTLHVRRYAGTLVRDGHDHMSLVLMQSLDADGSLSAE